MDANFKICASTRLEIKNRCFMVAMCLKNQPRMASIANDQFGVIHGTEFPFIRLCLIGACIFNISLKNDFQTLQHSLELEVTFERKVLLAATHFPAFNVIIKNRKRSIVYMQNYCNIVHNRLKRCCAAYSVHSCHQSVAKPARQFSHATQIWNNHDSFF